MKNKAQQEIVGFVLIVMIVVIGLVVYLGMSLRGGTENKGSLEVEAMLEALMQQTTECAITYVPDYDNVRDLLQSAYKDDFCSNIDESSRDYSEEFIGKVLNDSFASESTMAGYRFTLSVQYPDDTSQGVIIIESGNQTRTRKGASKIIPSGGSEKLLVQLTTYYI